MASSLADMGYDAAARVRDRLEAANIEPVIPPKANREELREYDKVLRRARHPVENFFEKLKHYRVIATRYDKSATAFLGAIHLAASVM